jgi:hypothetical protein
MDTMTQLEYIEWMERIAKALGCAATPVDLSAAIGTLLAKAQQLAELQAALAKALEDSR